MKKLSLILFSLSILFFTNYSQTEEKLIYGKAKVIDGDTIIINNEKIRFGGIDSPERKEIGYELSKQKLKEKLNKNIVNCIREKNKDRWGRTVAECFINGKSLSSFMVKNGYACDYVKYSKKKYAKEEEYAKSKKLGIWKMKFSPSWEKKCRKK